MGGLGRVIQRLWRSPELCCLSRSCCLSMESRASPRPGGLPYCVAFSQLLGLTVVAVTGAWLGLYRGGIAWESALQFNVHPLCMVIGLVFLQGDGESCSSGSRPERCVVAPAPRGLALLDLRFKKDRGGARRHWESKQEP